MQIPATLSTPGRTELKQVIAAESKGRQEVLKLIGRLHRATEALKASGMPGAAYKIHEPQPRGPRPRPHAPLQACLAARASAKAGGARMPTRDTAITRVLRGALEMVQMRVECTLIKDALWGDDSTEIRVILKELMDEEYVDEDA